MNTLDSKITLTQKELSIIINAFKNHLKAEKYSLFIFGSIVKGNSRIDSDIDILVDIASEIHGATKILIEEELENSDLPRKADVVEKRDLCESYKKEVLETAIRFFEND